MPSWIAGISVFCFAASYSVSLALEVSRLLFRSGVRGAVMLGFAAAGLVAHVLFLAYRGYSAVALASTPTTPLSSPFDYYLLAALFLALVYFYLTVYHQQAAIGLFVLPVVLALIGVAEFASDEPFPQRYASQVWGMIHGLFWLAGTVAMLMGFVAGLMYLVQSRRLKHKQLAHRGLNLPSLEWLERANSRSILISVAGVGMGIASGVLLNVINHRQQVDVVPWNDPVIWTSALMTGWVVVAAIFSWSYKPAQRGHKVAYLTITTGLVLACHLAISLLGSSEHGSRRAAESAATEAAAGAAAANSHPGARS